MASKPETLFYTKVNDRLPDTIEVEKMTNPYHGGTADIWYSGDFDCWIEYKHRATPLSGRSFKSGVTALQRDWLTRRYHQGRCVLVVVGVCQKYGFILPHRAWEQPVRPKALQLLALNDLARVIEQVCTNESIHRSYLYRGESK